MEVPALVYTTTALQAQQQLWLSGACTPGMTPRGPASDFHSEVPCLKEGFVSLAVYPLLQHTWNQDFYQSQQTPDSLCAPQTGHDYANSTKIDIGLTDAVRDTPPQLPATITSADGLKTNKPISFTCNMDGTFDPQAPAMASQALACNGTGLTGGKYFNNFYNVMSYFTNGCGAQKRKHTFTAGQNARKQCVWRCYRLNQCGDGTFAF